MRWKTLDVTMNKHKLIEMSIKGQTELETMKYKGLDTRRSEPMPWK